MIPNDQTIKTDAGKPRLSLVAPEAVYGLAAIAEYELVQHDNNAPAFVCKSRKKGKNWYGYFRCGYCGKEFEAQISNVTSQRQRSCGCAKGKLLIESKGTHGASKTRLYRIYHHIMDRCYNPNCKEYQWYGAKGIKCEFDTFEEFRDFAYSHGYNDTLTCERIDVNGNYSPNNITFIPLRQQARNTTKNVIIEYKGLSLCAAEWAEILNVNSDTLTARKRRCWSDIATLETPIRGHAEHIDISLVPVAIISAIKEVRLFGCQKYGDSESWRRVEPERYIDALLRHTLAFAENPHSVDEESGIEHYKHAACNLAFLCEMLKSEWHKEN